MHGHRTAVQEVGDLVRDGIVAGDVRVAVHAVGVGLCGRCSQRAEQVDVLDAEGVHVGDHGALEGLLVGDEVLEEGVLGEIADAAGEDVLLGGDEDHHQADAGLPGPRRHASEGAAHDGEPGFDARVAMVDDRPAIRRRQAKGSMPPPACRSASTH